MSSLPSRERELKHSAYDEVKGGAVSLPSRERELKLPRGGAPSCPPRSLPSRERELKQDAHEDQTTPEFVAPFTGA